LCELRLSDDGQGFDLSIVDRNGIKNMQARADRMGAKLEISSTPQGGTILRLLFPKIKTNQAWQSRAKREF
jgi:signal transduction histidine kinase